MRATGLRLGPAQVPHRRAGSGRRICRAQRRAASSPGVRSLRLRPTSRVDVPEDQTTVGPNVCFRLLRRVRHRRRALCPGRRPASSRHHRAAFCGLLPGTLRRTSPGCLRRSATTRARLLGFAALTVHVADQGPSVEPSATVTSAGNGRRSVSQWPRRPHDVQRTSHTDPPATDSARPGSSSFGRSTSYPISAPMRPRPPEQHRLRDRGRHDADRTIHQRGKTKQDSRPGRGGVRPGACRHRHER